MTDRIAELLGLDPDVAAAASAVQDELLPQVHRYRAAWLSARKRAAQAEQALAAVREYLETSDDTGIRTREHLLGVLDQAGVPSVVGAELAEADDGFRWHVLSQCPDETACPIHGLNEPSSAPVGQEDTAKPPGAACGHVREKWDGPYRLRDQCTGNPGHRGGHGPWQMVK